MVFHLVDEMSDVLKLALSGKKKKAKLTNKAEKAEK